MNEKAHLPFEPDAFSRLDETDDARFYARDRFVEHLDATALAEVERIIGTLVVEDAPVVLDLMASWQSHIPASVEPSRVVGLGLNPNELDRNRALTDRVLHDINRDPLLPLPDAAFDVVLNTVSVDYMTQPVEVFREVARVLKPGGLFLVTFSNRMFPEKAVRIWRESDEGVRVDLVRSYFERAGEFEATRLFASGGKPRPEDDRYASTGRPSDPVWAVYSERRGGAAARPPRPEIVAQEAATPDPEEIARRRKTVHETLRCPHCDVKMTRWKVPDSPFIEWDADYLYVCFNRVCPYTTRSWNVMQQQGNVGMGYRQVYHRERDCFYTVPDLGITPELDGVSNIPRG
jgi:SAM-dependent methyltransferase